MRYIEVDFPVEKLNEIAKKEANPSNRKPIYMIHKWWARRLGSVFRMILLTSFIDWEDVEEEARRRLGIGTSIEMEGEMEALIREKAEEIIWERFYSKNDFGGKVVLDPFMGGGTTVVESLRLGLKPIGIDINPVAWFVTKKEVEPLDLEAFEEEFNKLEKSVGEKIRSYYKTRCPICEMERKNMEKKGYEFGGEGKEELADVMYVFWVNKVKCLNPMCKKDVHLFPNFKIASKKKNDKVVGYWVFCPKCHHIFETDKDDAKTICPECGFEFVPKEGYVSNGTYSCPHCGQKYKVLDSMRKSGHIPEREMYAIEYYCPIHGRGYKKPDELDRALFEKAKKELEEQWDELLGSYIPDQEILDGQETHRLFGYNYRYFYELFNERQLLLLSMLLKEIMKIKDDNLKEHMLLVLSNILHYNNILCKYNPSKRLLSDLFEKHAYQPKNQPVENNIWGTNLGTGTFSAFFKHAEKGKIYLKNTYELKIEGEKAVRIVVNDYKECPYYISNPQTSEDLSFIPNKSVDAVITDPPYYNNVMYSEVADFFYIWLRLGLKDKYPWFQGEYSRNRREIIKNDIQGKDEEFFLKGIQRVFTEANRVLRDEGLMVFTFHHKDTEAWASMLYPILNAGFYITAVYPIQSEMSTSTHIINKKSISYDTIIICRKRMEESPETSWNSLRVRIYSETKEIIGRLLKTRPHLGEGDVKIIAMGKGLELYSKHYPKVLYRDGYLSPKEATFLMDGLVDQIIEEVKESELPTGLDDLSKIYMAYLLGEKTVRYDSLNMILRSKNFDVSALEKEKLIEKEKGNVFRVMGPMRRASFIEEKMKSGEELLYIDKVHYLIREYRRGKTIVQYLARWKDEIVSATLDIYYAKTMDEDIKKIKEMLEKTEEIRGIRTLDTFLKEVRK